MAIFSCMQKQETSLLIKQKKCLAVVGYFGVCVGLGGGGGGERDGGNCRISAGHQFW